MSYLTCFRGLLRGLRVHGLHFLHELFVDNVLLEVLIGGEPGPLRAWEAQMVDEGSAFDDVGLHSGPAAACTYRIVGQVHLGPQLSGLTLYGGSPLGETV